MTKTKEICSTLSEFKYKYAHYLINKYDNREEFLNIYKNNKNIALAIMEYRQILRSKGYGNVSYDKLYEAYIKCDYNTLHSLLQEMFVEYITAEQFEFVLGKLKEKEDNLNMLYQKHIENRDRRLLNIAMTL